MTRSLSQADVARLMADPSPKVRAETTGKIASQFADQELGEAERKIAEDIFRALVKDVELSVRETLAAHLKSSRDLPHDVALAMAKDVDSVALPVLKFSDVLTDSDLIEIVSGDDTAKQVAVAQRSSVSSSVADALIDTGNEKAVARLVSNEGADLNETALGRVMTNYKNSDAVSDSMARRPTLPAAIAEQLVSALSTQLQDYMVKKHDLPSDKAHNLILQARERATVTLLKDGSSDAELIQLVRQLNRSQRLSPSLIMRALCTGDMKFFEYAVAELAQVPVKNARKLIHDDGTLGLESVYKKAQLPIVLLPAVRACVELMNETDYDGGSNDRNRFTNRILERVLTQFEDPSSKMTEDDLEYLMSKLDQYAA